MLLTKVKQTLETAGSIKSLRGDQDEQPEKHASRRRRSSSGKKVSPSRAKNGNQKVVPKSLLKPDIRSKQEDMNTDELLSRANSMLNDKDFNDDDDDDETEDCSLDDMNNDNSLLSQFRNTHDRLVRNAKTKSTTMDGSDSGRRERLEDLRNQYHKVLNSSSRSLLFRRKSSFALLEDSDHDSHSTNGLLGSINSEHKKQEQESLDGSKSSLRSKSSIQSNMSSASKRLGGFLGCVFSLGYSTKRLNDDNKVGLDDDDVSILSVPSVSGRGQDDDIDIDSDSDDDDDDDDDDNEEDIRPKEKPSPAPTTRTSQPDSMQQLTESREGKTENYGDKDKAKVIPDTIFKSGKSQGEGTKDSKAHASSPPKPRPTHRRSQSGDGTKRSPSQRSKSGDSSSRHRPGVQRTRSGESQRTRRASRRSKPINGATESGDASRVKRRSSNRSLRLDGSSSGSAPTRKGSDRELRLDGSSRATSTRIQRQNGATPIRRSSDRAPPTRRNSGRSLRLDGSSRGTPSRPRRTRSGDLSSPSDGRRSLRRSKSGDASNMARGSEKDRTRSLPSRTKSSSSRSSSTRNPPRSGSAIRDDLSCRLSSTKQRPGLSRFASERISSGRENSNKGGEMLHVDFNTTSIKDLCGGASRMLLFPG